MLRTCFHLAALACVMLPATTVLSSQAVPATPGPLPAGAIRQLGEVRFPNVGHVLGVVFSPDGKTLAAGSWDDTVHLWDVATGKETRELKGHKGYVNKLAYSQGGKLLITQGRDRTIRLWDGDTGQPVRQFEGTPPITNSALAPDGKLLTANTGKDVVVWDVATGKEVWRKPLAEAIVGFTPDSTQIVCNVYQVGQRTIVFRDARTGKEQRNLVAPQEVGFAFTAALGGNKLLLADWRTTHLMDLQTGLMRKIATRSESGVTFLAFSPNGKVFALATADGAIRVLELATLGERCHFQGVETGTIPLAFSPDGKTLASGSTDSTIFLWDVPGTLTARVPSGKLSPADLEAVWTDLAGADVAKAYQAMARLLAQPPTAVAFLKEQVQPVAPGPDPALLDRMIKDLANERFTVRDKATTELAKLGDLADVALRAALKEKSTLEVRQRLEKLLRSIEQKDLHPPPEQLRLMRAVEVIEILGSPGGVQLLKTWAGGAPGALLTRQAHEALRKP
jgi:hypothetical protein